MLQHEAPQQSGHGAAQTMAQRRDHPDVSAAPADATLLDRLRCHARTQAHEIACRFLRSDGGVDALSFVQLEQRACALGVRIQEHTRPGDRAMLLYPSGLEFITPFLGCLYAGVIAVPSTTPRRKRFEPRLQAIFDNAQASLILTTQDLLPVAEQTFARDAAPHTCLATDTLTSTPDPLWTAPPIDLDTVAFLQYTSGSTGTPRGVVVTHGNLRSNIAAIRDGFGVHSHTIFVSWLPMFHGMGLIGTILSPLWAGVPMILMAPGSFLQEPVRWLRAISEYGGTFTVAPDFAWDLCAKSIPEDQKSNLDLSCLETAGNGAEPVRADTLERFYAAFAPCGFRREALFPCYGLAEATLFVSGGPSLTRPPSVLEVSGGALAAHQVAPPAGPEDEPRRLVGCGRVGGIPASASWTRKRACPVRTGEWGRSGSRAEGFPWATGTGPRKR